MREESAPDDSGQVHCARCQRLPRDGSDLILWEALDEGDVCPGCLTMLEAHARRTAE
jgi:hypothetical protein